MLSCAAPAPETLNKDPLCHRASPRNSYLPGTTSAVSSSSASLPAPRRLADREKEVLQLLAEGRSNNEVASLLSLGLSTVETHRANLMQKLNLHNTAEIVLYAVRKGLIV